MFFSVKLVMSFITQDKLGKSKMLHRIPIFVRNSPPVYQAEILIDTELETISIQKGMKNIPAWGFNEFIEHKEQEYHTPEDCDHMKCAIKIEKIKDFALDGISTILQLKSLEYANEITKALETLQKDIKNDFE
jgi:hypothetical protein